MKKTWICKTLLDIMSTKWHETDITELGIEKEQIINVVIDEGKVWLIYWAEEDE